MTIEELKSLRDSELHPILTDLLGQASDYHQLRAGVRALEAEMRRAERGDISESGYRVRASVWADRLAALLKEHGG